MVMGGQPSGYGWRVCLTACNDDVSQFENVACEMMKLWLLGSRVMDVEGPAIC